MVKCTAVMRGFAVAGCVIAVAAGSATALSLGMGRTPRMPKSSTSRNRSPESRRRWTTSLPTGGGRRPGSFLRAPIVASMPRRSSFSHGVTMRLLACPTGRSLVERRLDAK